MIAARAGYLCCNPNCLRPTRGAAPGRDGFIDQGEAAHITAAAPGGKRYDASLTLEQRKHYSNGLWLCGTHAKTVDSDEATFTVEVLRDWQQRAVQRSFKELLGGGPSLAPSSLAGGDERSDLAAALAAAAADIATFKLRPGWPGEPAALNLHVLNEDGGAVFSIGEFARAIRTYDQAVIVSPPGTGKTTSLIQLVEEVVDGAAALAVLVPLGEWSVGTASLLGSIAARRSFGAFAEADFRRFAGDGQLVLALDGWNELGTAARRKVRVELEQLRREYPSLSVVITTRREALAVPVNGIVAVEIEPLSSDQQRAIARTLRSTEGEDLLVQAWRTRGLRELVSIPLYLTALMSNFPSAKLPQTKEEVLGMFVRQHTRDADDVEALRELTFDKHDDFLAALAASATHEVNTSFTDDAARSVVAKMAQDLIYRGQASAFGQPMEIVDALVAHHVLVRGDPGSGSLAFQHQQIREWYASHHVEEVMRHAVVWGSVDHKYLREEVLDVVAWEEPVLFAIERLSRGNDPGVHAAAEAILTAVEVDPDLAAEMIYRASDLVWARVKPTIVPFAMDWHEDHQIDRALAFMIETGRPEFADVIWGFLGGADHQLIFKVARLSPTLRLSALGPDVAGRIRALPDETRKVVIAEIASQSGIEGLAVAAKLAQYDPSPAVKFATVEQLAFRRADTEVAAILKDAPDEVWAKVARKHFPESSPDPEIDARLIAERQKLFREDLGWSDRVSALLNDPPADIDARFEQLVASAEFEPNKESHRQLFRRIAHDFPAAAARGLARRLAQRLPLPYGEFQVLRAHVEATDDDPIAAIALAPDTGDQVANAAASLIGPKTTGRLMDELLLLDAHWRRTRSYPDGTPRERRAHLDRMISHTRIESFLGAVTARARSTNLVDVSTMSDLIAGHGNRRDEDDESSVAAYAPLVPLLLAWSDIVLKAPEAMRYDLSHVAKAIGRTGSEGLLDPLERLLSADIERRLAQRAAFLAGHRSGQNESAMGYEPQYHRAFVSIGGEKVAEMMTRWLPNSSFGAEAGSILLELWKRRQPQEVERMPRGWPDFSQHLARRAARQGAPPTTDHPYAASIFAVVEQCLAEPDRAGLALDLAKFGFSLPRTDHSALIRRLLAVPDHRGRKHSLLASLVMDGEVIGVAAVLQGVEDLIEAAKTQTWLLDQNAHELKGWLALFAFSDRPEAVFEALALLDPSFAEPHQLERVFAALRHAPVDVAEPILLRFATQDPRVIQNYEWLGAIEETGSSKAVEAMFALLGAAGVNANQLNGLTHMVERMARSNPAARRAILDFYLGATAGGAKALAERALTQTPDEDAIVAIVETYGREGRSYDGSLWPALRDIAIDHRQSSSWVGMTEAFARPIPELRKRLFAIATGSHPAADVAAGVLSAIDQLRQDYGRAASQRRHPDIKSGIPWPRALVRVTG